MKKIYLLMLLITGLAFKPLFAQIDTAALLDGYIQSEFIFEGEVIDKCYYDDDNGNIFTCHKIQISKIIKGNYECGTINLITEGGVLNGYDVQLSHNSVFNIGEVGVFLCKTSMLPEPDCGWEADNPIYIMLTFAAIGNIEYLFDQVSYQVVGFNSIFPTIEDFYEYLNAIGIYIINCDGSIIPRHRAQSKTRSFGSNKLVVPVKISQEAKVEKLKNLPKIISHYNNLGKSGEQIEFTISNPVLNSTGKQLTFDISIKSNVNATYLLSCAFRLKYNTNAFEPNVTATGYALGPNFTGYSDIYYEDYTSDIKEWTIVHQTGPMRQITTTSQKIISLTFPIGDCTKNYNLEIVPFPSFGVFCGFYDAATGGNYHNYDSYISGSTLSGSSSIYCPPEIIDLSKTSLGIGAGYVNVSGGIGDEFYINGNHFGTTKGKVFVRNADLGGPSTGYIALDDYDVTWANSQIKVILPGYCNNAQTSYDDHIPGSGFIYVQDALNFESNKNMTLNVNYSVDNFGKGSGTSFYKNNTFLFSGNTDHKYHFKLNTSITDQSMIDCIAEALRLWSCKVGVGFVLDNGTTTNGYALDNYNVISISDLSDATKWASTTLRRDKNCSTNSNMPSALPEVDIRINSTKLIGLFYDMTGLLPVPNGKYDFFHIILHEIGHALLQNHVINEDDFMHANLSPAAVGPRNTSQRRLNFRPGNLAGGDYIVDKSQSQTFSMTCTSNLYTTKLSTSCRNFAIGLMEADNLGEPFKLYPNPFSNQVNIQIDYALKGILSISIVDIYGRVVLEQTVLSKNDSIITFETQDLKTGMYYAVVATASNKWIVPISCIK